MPKPSHKRFLPQVAAILRRCGAGKIWEICVIGGLDRDHSASPVRSDAPEDWRRPKAGAWVLPLGERVASWHATVPGRFPLEHSVGFGSVHVLWGVVISGDAGRCRS